MQVPRKKDDEKPAGAVRFVMGYPTPFIRARVSAWHEHVEYDEPVMADIAANIMWLAAVTRNIEVDGNGEHYDNLREFWSMVQNDAPPSEWVQFFGENVHESFYNQWILAHSESGVIEVPRSDVHGAALTDAEKLDPN